MVVIVDTNHDAVPLGPAGLADNVVVYLHSNGNRIGVGGQVSKVNCSGADTVGGEFLVDGDMWVLSSQTDGSR